MVWPQKFSTKLLGNHGLWFACKMDVKICVYTLLHNFTTFTVLLVTSFIPLCLLCILSVNWIKFLPKSLWQGSPPTVIGENVGCSIVHEGNNHVTTESALWSDWASSLICYLYFCTEWLHVCWLGMLQYCAEEYWWQEAESYSKNS